MLACLQQMKKFVQCLQSMALKWTAEALRSLDNIAAYIAQRNPQRATTFVSELRDKIQRLETFPALGKVGRVQDTRELVLHPNYIAIYRIRGSDVQILRIHHAARQA